MLRISCILLLFFMFHDSFCQKTDEQKTHIGLYPVMQLSSTRMNACLIAKIYRDRNCYYLGAKTPISTNNIYGYFPVGIIAGYGYQMFENNKWKMATLFDGQWLSSKTQYMLKPTRYIDLTVNYQLTYKICKKLQINSSFGYGAFLKYFYQRYSTKARESTGVSGQIAIGAEYVL
jgi:hypothetical protein